MLAKKVIVFDFDGTLIQSNRLKYEAYFQLFPNEPGYRKLIETILQASFEEARYDIWRRILLGLGTGEGLEDRVAGLAGEYNRVVLAGAIACPETGGAAALPMWIGYMEKALAGVPESFKVLVKELQSLALDIRMLGADNSEILIRDDNLDINEQEKAREELEAAKAELEKILRQSVV